MQLVQLPSMLFVKTDKYCLKLCTNVMSVTVEWTYYYYFIIIIFRPLGGPFLVPRVEEEVK